MLRNINQPKLCNRQRYAFGGYKIDEQCNLRDDTERKIQRKGSSHSEDPDDPNRFAV